MKQELEDTGQAECSRLDLRITIKYIDIPLFKNDGVYEVRCLWGRFSTN